MINLDKLYREYFSEDISKLSFFKMEKMYNDFKLVLMLIENFKNSYKNNNMLNMELSDIDASFTSKSDKENSYLDKLYEMYKVKQPENTQHKTNNGSFGLNLINSIFGGLGGVNKKSNNGK